MKNTRRTCLTLILTLVLALGAFAPVQAQASPVNFTQVYNDVSPSVVAIVVEAPASNAAMQIPGLETPPGGQLVRSGGSGFVFDDAGHIITNYHVVNGAERIEVNFLDGTRTEGEIVGLDADSDLAVVRVNVLPDSATPVEFADSESLVVGQTVLAIGSPFGQNWTLTTGIVSGLQRRIEGLEDFSIGGVIQTDAAINPGNSGGPLLDEQGRVIGVNAQIQSAVRSSAGVGFAIPANLTQRVAQELIENGFIQYSYLGIQGGDVPLRYLQAYELPNNLRGVLVSEAVDGGPAARAGLQDASGEMPFDGLPVFEQFDIITAVNGTPMFGIDALITYISQQTRPGDTVTLSVLRNGTEELQLDVRLMPRP